MICLPTAALRFSENQTPISCAQEDFYFSTTDAIAECEHVFIQGNALLQRWHATKSFTVAELGFGAARNFLVTAQHWLTNTKSGTLHYFSVEHAPLCSADLAKVIQRYPLSDSLKEALLQQYPSAIRGFHPLSLAHGRIRLILIFDDASEAIDQLEDKADAWFLDGFSPACNAEAWNQELLRKIFHRTAKDGTLATYSAASHVRNGLQTAGFDVQRKAGFGRKREMLCATKPHTATSVERAAQAPFRWRHRLSKSESCRTVSIIGAGLAGCCLAYALSQRNWRVNLYDSAVSLANGASGNAAAILMPKISLDHNLASQLTCSGYLYTIRWLQQLAQHGLHFEWSQCGGLQFGRDQTQYERMLKIERQENFPKDWLRPVNADEATKISGFNIQQNGWYFPDAACINLNSLCDALIRAGGGNIQTHYLTPITTLLCTAEASHFDPTSGTLNASDNHPVIIASGEHSANFAQTEHLPVRKKRGQITNFRSPSSQPTLRCILNGDGYLTPAMNGQYTVGASFITQDSSTEIRESEHLQNLAKLQKLAPEFSPPSLTEVEGRAAVRAVSRDRFPMVGPVSKPAVFADQYKSLALGNRRSHIDPSHYYPNLYVLTGFSSRGLCWIPICAEYLAAKLNAEPSPLPSAIADAIHPNRFLFKTLKKNLSTAVQHEREWPIN